MDRRNDDLSGSDLVDNILGESLKKIQSPIYSFLGLPTFILFGACAATKKSSAFLLLPRGDDGSISMELFVVRHYRGRSIPLGYREA